MEAPVKPDKIDLLTESPILLAIKCLICKNVFICKSICKTVFLFIFVNTKIDLLHSDFPLYFSTSLLEPLFPCLVLRRWQFPGERPFSPSIYQIHHPGRHFLYLSGMTVTRHPFFPCYDGDFGLKSIGMSFFFFFFYKFGMVQIKPFLNANSNFLMNRWCCFTLERRCCYDVSQKGVIDYL